MAAATGEISVDVVGEEIVVTKPGTTFLLAYRKSVEEPRLVLRRSRIPPTTVSIRSAFRAHAYQAAVIKARESQEFRTPQSVNRESPKPGTILFAVGTGGPPLAEARLSSVSGRRLVGGTHMAAAWSR